MLGDALAASGLAWLGHGVVSGLQRAILGGPRDPSTAYAVDRFEGWADDLWQAHRGRYGFLAARDTPLLETLYPGDFAPLTRLRVQRAGRDLGWVCTQALGAQGTWLEPHFGDLRVGIISDAFADPDRAAVVLGAGVRRLAADGVDLVVTNQTHPAWCAAIRKLGFWPGPSTLAFSWSPSAGESIGDPHGVHMTRSDGDGPQGEGEVRPPAV